MLLEDGDLLLLLLTPVVPLEDDAELDDSGGDDDDDEDELDEVKSPSRTGGKGLGSTAMAAGEGGGVLELSATTEAAALADGLVASVISSSSSSLVSWRR